MDVRWNLIAGIDLDAVRQKFAFKKGRWWCIRKNAVRVEREYRQFLYLIVCNPEKTVVPGSRDLDDFWHEHILDTAKYAQDCNTILGRFIHHNPHLPEGTAPHREAFAATREMYKTAFRASFGKGAGVIGCGTTMPNVSGEGGKSAGHHTGSGGHHGGGHQGGGHGGGHGCGGHGGGHGCGGSGH